MDLTPRHEVEESSPSRVRREVQGRRRAVVMSVFAILLILAGFVVIKGLRNATVFFRNVDEAVEARDDLGDRRFRLQGRVIPSSVTSEGGVTTFQLIHNCSVASVRHTTDPPQLFESPWIPVVLEGHWQDGSETTVAGTADFFFLSDNMLVKHTNEYADAHESRVSEAPPDGLLDDCDLELGLGDSGESS